MRPVPDRPCIGVHAFGALAHRILSGFFGNLGISVSFEFQTIVVATRNAGKLREFRSLLFPTGWQVLGLADLSIDREYEESGRTFAENARLKVIACSHDVRLPVLADDSGLEVDALGGRPGIYSARYAGPGASDSDRIRKLL